ncbi:MAG TPA: hypothetical protein VHY84_26725 [Bryobacteraceae bacterium]|nr:hypothetical protein [Bryobacteraceae bacterium]
MREILRANPNLALTPPMLPHLVTANHTLHESCHCVSDHLFASRRTDEPFRQLIQALCTEAFANSIERLAMADLSSPTDGLFFALNSYVPIITGPTVASLKTAVGQFGLSAVLSMAMLCYFCINIFPSPPPAPMILEFLCESGFEIGDDANHWVEHLSKDIFIIKSTFRDDTSLIWFSLIGLDKEFTALGRRELNSGFLRDLEIRSSIEIHVKHLEATIARGKVSVNYAAAG